jgi:hypothetical protein
MREYENVDIIDFRMLLVYSIKKACPLDLARSFKE